MPPSDLFEMTPADLAAWSDGYRSRANYEAWLHGIYVMYGLLAIISPIVSKPGRKPFSYPNRPDKALAPRVGDKLERAQETTEERERREKLRAEIYMRQMFEAGKNWGKN